MIKHIFEIRSYNPDLVASDKEHVVENTIVELSTKP